MRLGAAVDRRYVGTPVGGFLENWDITKTVYKVGDFVSWQRSGALVLSPSFQRRPVGHVPSSGVEVGVR